MMVGGSNAIGNFSCNHERNAKNSQGRVETQDEGVPSIAGCRAEVHPTRPSIGAANASRSYCLSYVEPFR